MIFFAGKELQNRIIPDSSVHGMEQTQIEICKKDFDGLCFVKDEDTFAVIGASVAENFGVPML